VTLDRYGERLVDDEDQADVDTTPAHRYDGGWLDRDAEPAVPCTVCRPWLSQPRQRAATPDVDRIRRGVQLVRDALAQGRTEATR
jgi:hypothetical protein